jgi:hypothetical protein
MEKGLWIRSLENEDRLAAAWPPFFPILTHVEPPISSYFTRPFSPGPLTSVEQKDRFCQTGGRGFFETAVTYFL